MAHSEKKSGHPCFKLMSRVELIFPEKLHSRGNCNHGNISIHLVLPLSRCCDTKHAVVGANHAAVLRFRAGYPGAVNTRSNKP